MPTIEFHYEYDFQLENNAAFLSWIEEVANSENYSIGSLNYIFCNDEYLAQLHLKYLNKEDLTDIITFDYVEDDVISGDIFISIERVKDNASSFKVDFKEELLRVMSHGLLHLMGYQDKSDEDSAVMREKEDEKIKMFHVEQ